MTAIVSGQGRIAKVGEVRAAGNTEVLEARVAVDNGWGDRRKTDFLSMKIWGPMARTMETRLKVGGQVFFSGEFSTNEWGNEDAKKLDLQVRVNVLELIGPRDAAGSDDRRAAGAGSTYRAGRQAAGGSAAVTDTYGDDEIPF
ncbi:MAG: single-stranded DNA-binding protein [Rhodobacteraceae bacterium]|nr:single-stranded DNA-binding protein [Paracoccaceae bacterium]MCZ8084980.1 single-stranded DNA-binding protein [Paracoccaceae bacterium]